MTSSTMIFNHPVLGAIKGRLASPSILQLHGIPYGSISQRFGRSAILTQLPISSNSDDSAFDATGLPPASIQPLDAPKMDAQGNQFPVDSVADYSETQDEDCLSVTITLPASTLSSSNLPVLTFWHGGAFFLGTGERPYYRPITMVQQALDAGRPLIFVSMQYRLGALGFFHTPEASDIVPANNGLHDQRIGMDWILRFIEGFGGNPANITAIGQSAGGESVTVHNLSGLQNLWKQSIALSGSLVTMPSNTSAEHHANFLKQAESLKIDMKGKGSSQIAEEMIAMPVDRIRDLGYVGAPCSSSGLLPFEKPSMALMRQRRPSSVKLQTQIVGSCGYDGSISYIMMQGDKSRKNHSQAIRKIAMEVLKHPQELLDLYEIREDEEDSAALRKIVQFESDIGFFAPSLALAQGNPGKSFLLIFELGNPFDGPLPRGACATHTWDVVALLGAYEDRLDSGCRETIRAFRQKIIDYIVASEPPWPAWTEKHGHALIVDSAGLRAVEKEEYIGRNTRRGQLLALAEKEGGEDGCDILWTDVCRRFLMMKGE